MKIALGSSFAGEKALFLRCIKSAFPASLPGKAHVFLTFLSVLFSVSIVLILTKRTDSYQIVRYSTQMVMLDTGT